jgi:hypothetical protein
MEAEYNAVQYTLKAMKAVGEAMRFAMRLQHTLHNACNSVHALLRACGAGGAARLVVAPGRAHDWPFVLLGVRGLLGRLDREQQVVVAHACGQTPIKGISNCFLFGCPL